MKRIWWGAATIILLISIIPVRVFALDTVPSATTPNKVTGPLIITGYSFSGHSLKYVQIYNHSDNVVALDGWQVYIEYASVQQNIKTLEGLLAPGRYASVANVATAPSATFSFVDTIPSVDPVMTTVGLQPPTGQNIITETASPTITSSTPRMAGSPATFHFMRNISASTGSYLTTFMAFTPSSTFTLVSDALYEPPQSPPLQIVEIYPDATACAPFDSASICNDYVKIFNASDSTIDLGQYRIRTGAKGQAASTSNTVVMSGIIGSGSYVSVPLSLNASGNWVWLEDRYGSISYDQTVINYPSSSGYDLQAWAFNALSDNWEWTMYPMPGNQASRFPEQPLVNACSGIVISEIAANVASEDQFIEVSNIGTSAINLLGCALQTNRSQTSSFVFSDVTLRPAEYMTIYVRDTPLTLTKTTSGSVYLLTSDLADEIDLVSYADLSENTSWALIADDWKQTFTVTPNQSNVWLEYQLCAEGMVRNTDTGMCNKITVTASLSDCGIGKYRSEETNRCRSFEEISSLSPCDTDQYRSPETNRCRSLLTVASSLTPCAASQTRNPETNRCRSVESVDALSPCAAGQERNPDTNRCRSVTSSSVAADFPVEVAAATSEATLGWWAFGGVGLIAAAYAGWEWRREVTGWVRRIVPFGIGRP